MYFKNYKTILFRQEDGSWVAEIPCLPACYTLSETRDLALAELRKVFDTIEEEYCKKGLKLPMDTTEIVGGCEAS
jgi:predicted RNase H-like HicB family nuclease